MMALEDLVASLPPVGIAEVVAEAELVDRVDRKYLVTDSELERLVDAVQASHTVLSFDGSRVSRYSTVYADSADLACYRAHLQGRRRRWKARTRRYLDTDLARVEVKTKGLRGRTVKEFREVPVQRHGVVDEGMRRFIDRNLRSAYGFPLDVELHPTLEVTFRRATLVDLHRGERLTIDVGLDLWLPGGEHLGSLRSDAAVVESKSMARVGSADRALRAIGVRGTPCSKYAMGMALSRPDVPAAALRALLRRWFVATVDGTAPSRPDLVEPVLEPVLGRAG